MLTFDDHNDALRAHTDFRRMLAARNFDAMRRGWLDDRARKHGHETAVSAAAAFDRMIEDTVSAETVWMTHEMMDLVQHAMHGFDATEPVTVDDCFIPHGFMVLPEPFYSLDIYDKRVANRALLWRLDPDGVVILGQNDDGTTSMTYDLTWADKGTVEAVVRFTEISYIGDDDDWTEWADDSFREAMRSLGINWGIAHTVALPIRFISTMGTDPGKAAWLLFWRVAQKLMAETIITSERVPAARPVRREAQRFGIDMGAPRVIELRRPRGREADVEGEHTRDVNWTHRWIVRGHWRDQPYGPKGSPTHTKQIWIGAYEKGPENLPLVIRDRVWNWDR